MAIFVVLLYGIFLCIKFWVKLSCKINVLVNRYHMEKLVSLFRMLQVNFRENQIRVSTIKTKFSISTPVRLRS